MPKSRSRAKPKAKSRYQIAPDKPKRKRTSSPRWYAPVVLGVMGLGVLVIVLNYMGVLPFTGGETSSVALIAGLGLIAVGFLGTTGIR
jgi:small-conductance mechanosensitive channel